MQLAQPTVARRGARDRPAIPLFWRLFVPNACVLSVACVVLIIEPANGRIVALVGGLVIMLATNVVLMRRTFGPLMRLTATMHRIDPLRPGERVPTVGGGSSEVTVLADAFNSMLDRIETERRESAQRMAATAESDRRHLARELHDDVGQMLTALVLQLARMRAKGASEDALAEAHATAESALDDVRRLARRLRPEVLDELGLNAALTVLCNRLSEQTGLVIHRTLPDAPSPLTIDQQLVVYRVAQESLTNVVRHSGAREAHLGLHQRADHVEVLVLDDGKGLPPDEVLRGEGIRGMRERAVLIGADLTLSRPPSGGTAVRLYVPLAEDRR